MSQNETTIWMVPVEVPAGVIKIEWVIGIDQEGRRYDLRVPAPVRPIQWYGAKAMEDLG